MTIDTERILAELYEIDPALRSHEEVLRRVIPVIAETKPNVVVDDAFVMRLRGELMHAHVQGAIAGVPSSLSPFFSFGFAIPALMALFVVGGALIATHDTGSGMRLAITTTDARAFGSLAPATEAVATSGTTVGPEAASALSRAAGIAAPAVGLGGGTPTESGTYPTSLGTRYVYGGGAFTVPATGYVYKRITDDTAGKQLVSALGGMHVGFALTSSADLKARSIEVAEDTDYGYAFSLNIPQGAISINANWEKWHMDTRQEPGLLASAMPSDDALIAVADRFFTDHRISTASYGSPIIDKGWKDMPPTTTLDGRPLPAYAPDTLMITYPLVIDGMPVYESWGAPYGLQVLIDTRVMKVSSVNNLMTLRYERSPYALETDAAKITRLATSDGAAAAPRTPDGTATQTLDTPQVVLMKQYTNTEELLIPAMRFPIKDASPSQPASRMVPLVKDIADSLPDTGTVCAMDVQACPDGTYVKRTGPACEFEACPGAAVQKITVKIGESGSANGITVTPSAVLEDSRCPMGMMCIQAGTVRVQTTLESGLGSGSAPQTFTLNTPVTTETEEITLTGVMPLKKADATISPSDYQFVFEVRKR